MRNSHSMSQVEIFVGNIHRDISKHDLEDIFENYGRVVRCELKQGASNFASSYGFLEFESGSDAEAAIKGENGREHQGKSFIVQWARSTRRGPSNGNNRNNLTCYNCSRPGHISRNCRENRGDGDDRYHNRRNTNYDRRGGGGRGGYRRRSPSRSRSRSRS
ncbi:unnamed protein product [Rotaria sordida]|uniref:RNA-binding protein n=1 Tax=Rotaria sordida TaxID=392033 RepID=A0A819EA14_9BILA|nr:unnamed protein product [Rotaria sordida]CAF3846858.1 unnamed protein product [Rotaria sordida]